MGFLDNLLKKESGKILSSVLESVVENLTDTTPTTPTATKPPVSEPKTQPIETHSDTNPDEEDCCGDRQIVNFRILKAVTMECQEYTLRGNIPASELGASPDARDYTYGIYLDGVPKAMIMVLDVPSHYRKRDVILAHRACEERGIYCMNLMLHLPNRLSYIAKQLRDNIKK